MIAGLEEEKERLENERNGFQLSLSLLLTPALSLSLAHTHNFSLSQQRRKLKDVSKSWKEISKKLKRNFRSTSLPPSPPRDSHSFTGGT
jgi:hypothetical protein